MTAWQVALALFLILYAVGVFVAALPAAVLAVIAFVAGILVLTGK